MQLIFPPSRASLMSADSFQHFLFKESSSIILNIQSNTSFQLAISSEFSYPFQLQIHKSFNANYCLWFWNSFIMQFWWKLNYYSGVMENSRNGHLSIDFSSVKKSPCIAMAWKCEIKTFSLILNKIIIGILSKGALNWLRGWIIHRFGTSSFSFSSTAVKDWMGN